MRVGSLRVFGRLDRYVGGMFAMSFATAILLIVALGIVIDMATHLSFFEPSEDGNSASLSLLFQYYSLTIPFLYVQFSPFVTVIAAMFTVSRLVKKNEFTAGLAAGVSAQRLLACVFAGSVLAAAATFVIREFATDTVGERRDALLIELTNHSDEALMKNLWLRDIAGNVVHLGEYRPGTLTGKPPEGRPLEATLVRRGVVMRVTADRIVWVESGPRTGWRLEGGLVREVSDAAKVEPAEWLDVVQFTPKDVAASAKGAGLRVLELSFSQVRSLSRRDPDNTSYQTLLQYLLTFPLANIVLVLCAIPFLVGRDRGKGGEAVVAGLLLCVAFFCVDFVARSMGLSGDLSPLMSAWLPVLLFGALGISLTHFMRT